jgi:predicted ester cyclase
MIADGDVVSTRLTMRGKHVGSFMGAAPTGAQYNIGVLMMDRVVEGLIVQHWANADWVSVLGRLGIIPPPPEA